MLKAAAAICGAVFAILFFADFALCHESHPDETEWNPLSAGPVTTWTAPVCGRPRLVIQPFFFYNRTAGSFDSKGRYKSLKDKERKHEYQEQLFIQYGITDRLEVDAQGIFQQKYRHKDGEGVISTGFGDSYLFLRYCLFEETRWLPHATGLFQLKLPTGKYQKAKASKLGTDLMGADTGGGSYDHGYGLMLTKKVKPFVLHADAIYTFPIETRVDGIKTRYANYLNYDLGVEYFLPKGFNLMVEFNRLEQGDKKQNGSLIPGSDLGWMVVASGVGWSCKPIQALLAYQRTIGGTNIDVKDSIVFTFVYTF